jgi:hypothetical protein
MPKVVHLRTTDFGRVFASAPLDKTAAVATSGASGADDPTIEQFRASLKVRLNRIELLLKDKRITPDQKRALGQRRLEIQGKLQTTKRRRDFRGIAAFICDVAKERTTVAAWRSILDEARRRFEQAEADRLAAEAEIAVMRAQEAAPEPAE